MSYFDFTYEEKLIYSCENIDDFWLCLRNLSLLVVKHNWDNGKIKEIFKEDSDRKNKAEFIINDRIDSLQLRRKNPKMFSIRNKDELPKRAYEPEIPGIKPDIVIHSLKDAQKLSEESNYACPNCKSRMFYVDGKDLWCPECNKYIEYIE